MGLQKKSKKHNLNNNNTDNSSGNIIDGSMPKGGGQDSVGGGGGGGEGGNGELSDEGSTRSEEEDEDIKKTNANNPLFSQSTTLLENSCPDLMLGLRALDVEYDFFREKPVMQDFVKEKLAESLDIEQADVNFCYAKEGSTILSFDAGEGLSNRWTEVVNDPSSNIHNIFQLDPIYPPTISKPSLANYAPHPPPSSRSAPPETHPDFSFEPLPFPVEESKVLNAPDESIYVDMGVMDMPQVIDKDRAPPPPTLSIKGRGGEVPGWVWGLIAVAVIVVFAAVIAVVMLMLIAKKHKNIRVKRGLSSGQQLDMSGNVEVGFTPTGMSRALGRKGSRGRAEGEGSVWGPTGVGMVGVFGGRPIKASEGQAGDLTDMQRWDGTVFRVSNDGVAGLGVVEFELEKNVQSP